MKEAMFYKPLKNLMVHCMLCPHNCVIENNEWGRCSVRKNIEGILYSMNYGKILSRALDPIEKKPLYHFYPGKKIFSVATFACNMTCQFCQNYELSQKQYERVSTPPEQLVEEIQGLGIAFTYNEPIVWFEYIYDVVKLIKEKRPELKVVLVTNGFINKAPLELLLPYIDAFNVDLKSFDDTFYKEICGARLAPVLEAIPLMAKKHVEVTTLMVSKWVTLKHIESIAAFIQGISKEIPLHITRYFPQYLMTEAPTSIDLMTSALEVSKKYLKHVYLGNIADQDHGTRCSVCGALIIKRRGHHTEVMMKGPICRQCKTPHYIKGL